MAKTPKANLVPLPNSERHPRRDAREVGVPRSARGHPHQSRAAAAHPVR